jgi:glutaredoxin
MYTGHRRVPYVFFGFNFIGGVKDLKRLDERGELDRMAKE